MPATSGEPRAAGRRIIDKTQAWRLIAAMLDGCEPELTVRVLKHELVIRNPRDPGKGRIYVEYPTGVVSWVRPVREDWGILEGYAGDDDTGQQVSAAQIIDTLTGRTRETSDSP